MKYLIPVVAIVSLIIFFHPFFSGKAIAGHDAGYHYTRLQLFAKALADGQLPVRWIEIPNLHLSHPLFEFYPTLFYYPSAILMLLGTPYVDTAYITLILAALFGWLGMYLFVKKLFGSKLAATLAAALFLFTPYRLSQLYVRAAFVEFLAVSFLPFLFLGAWLIFHEEKPSFLWRGIFCEAIGTAVVLTGHQPTLLMALFPLACWIIFLWIKTQNSQRLVVALAGFALGLSLSAFFLLPAIFEQRFIRLSNLSQGYFDFRQHFASFSQLIFSPWDFGISQKGLGDKMSFQVGIVNWAVVLAAVATVVYKIYKGYNDYKNNVFFLIVFFFGLFMATGWSLPLWERISLFSFIQYPWRFLTITTLATSVLAGYLWSFCEKQWFRENKYRLFYLLGALFIIIIFNVKYIAPASYFSKNYFNLGNPDLVKYTVADSPFFGVEMGYLPIWVQQVNTRPPEEKIQTLTGQARISLISDRVTLKQFKIEVNKYSTIRFNTHYFPGWIAQVVDNKSKKEIVPSFNNSEGLMDLSLAPGGYHVSLRFKKTPVRTFADYLSLGTALGLLAFWIFSCSRFWSKYFGASSAALVYREKASSVFPSSSRRSPRHS